MLFLNNDELMITTALVGAFMGLWIEQLDKSKATNPGYLRELNYPVLIRATHKILLCRLMEEGLHKLDEKELAPIKTAGAHEFDFGMAGLICLSATIESANEYFRRAAASPGAPARFRGKVFEERFNTAVAVNRKIKILLKIQDLEN